MNSCPWCTRAGADEMTGLGPLNRYGGLKISLDASALSLRRPRSPALCTTGASPTPFE
jgi:hypothetical protein